MSPKKFGLSGMLFAILSLLISSSTHGQTPVKNVVLFHGAFADGSGWKVSTIQLPTLQFNFYSTIKIQLQWTLKPKKVI